MSAVKTPSVPALERGLAILELVVKSRTGLTFSQIARRVDFPKSSTHCLLLTLDREGFLRRSGNAGRYVCGPRLAHIAHWALDGAAIRERAAPILRELSVRFGMTVHMAIFEDDQVILIAKAALPGARGVSTWMGKRLDLHCTSLGKCLAAYLPEAEVERLTRERGLFRHNENTIISLSRLKLELERTRQLGYAIDDEEEELGVRCVGVPLFVTDGSVTAALSVTGTTESINSDNSPAIVEALKSSARQISALLAAAHTAE